MSVASSDKKATVIRRRQVYYLAGFDARGARFYHPLYKNEAAKQDLINGSQTVVGPLESEGGLSASWRVFHSQDGQETETHYTFLCWEDIVRAHWPASKWRLACDVFRVNVNMFRWGVLRKLWQSSRRFTAAMLAPFAYVVLTLLLTVLAGWGVTSVLTGSMPSFGLAVNALAGVLAAAGAWCVLLWGGERTRVFWLGRAWVFFRYWELDVDGEVAERWRSLAAHIANDSRNADADEILLIGHSAGTMAMVCVLGELLQLQQGSALKPRFRLMTLGHVLPMLAWFPNAKSFREHVNAVVRSGVPWLDFTAPSDPLCMALVNPLEGAVNLMPDISGATSVGSNVVIRSSRFDRMFETSKHQRLRQSAFRIHFQYLMSTDLPVYNDYFSITAGHKPLAYWMERRV